STSDRNTSCCEPRLFLPSRVREHADPLDWATATHNGTYLPWAAQEHAYQESERSSDDTYLGRRRNLHTLVRRHASNTSCLSRKPRSNAASVQAACESRLR